MLKNLTLTKYQNLPATTKAMAVFFLNKWNELNQPKINSTFFDEIEYDFQNEFVFDNQLSKQEFENLEIKNYACNSFNHCLVFSSFLSYDKINNQLKLINDNRNLQEDLYESLTTLPNDDTLVLNDQILTEISLSLPKAAREWISSEDSVKFKKAFAGVNWWLINNRDVKHDPKLIYALLSNYSEHSRKSQNLSYDKYVNQLISKIDLNKIDTNSPQYQSMLILYNSLNVFDPKANKIDFSNVHFEHKKIKSKTIVSLKYPIDIPLKTLAVSVDDMKALLKATSFATMIKSKEAKHEKVWKSIDNPLIKGISSSTLIEGFEAILLALNKGATIQDIQQYWVINRMLGLPENKCWIPLPDGSYIKSNTYFTLNLLPYKTADGNNPDLSLIQKLKNNEYAYIISEPHNDAKIQTAILHETLTDSNNSHFICNNLDWIQKYSENSKVIKELPKIKDLSKSELIEKFSKNILISSNCLHNSQKDNYELKLNDYYLKNYSDMRDLHILTTNTENFIDVTHKFFQNLDKEIFPPRIVTGKEQTILKIIKVTPENSQLLADIWYDGQYSNQTINKWLKDNSFESQKTAKEYLNQLIHKKYSNPVTVSELEKSLKYWKNQVEKVSQQFSKKSTKNMI